MSSLFQDIRFAVRSLVRDKPFTLLALLTLALCTGANTAIFSLINAVLIKPLPYPDSHQLVVMYNSYPGAGVERASTSAPNYKDRRTATDVFEEVSLVQPWSFALGEADTPEQIEALAATPSFFRALRANAAAGRIFTEEEGEVGNNKVVLLNYELWARLYALDPGAIGKSIRLDDEPYQIVGVLPADFEFVTRDSSLSRDVAVWVPLPLTARDLSDERLHSNNYEMIARLADGVSVAQASARIEALNQAADEREPRYHQLLLDAQFRTVVTPLLDEAVAQIRPTLMLLQGGVFFVLLIGCVNVANLFLVRSSRRLRELGVRSAMGAGKRRLTRLLLTESTLLGLMGGVLGLGLGFGGMQLIRVYAADHVPRGAGLTLDMSVLTATLLVAVLTGLLFGAVPVAQLLRRNLNDIFRTGGRTGTADRGALRTRSVLVVVQVSLAFVLLCGAGLLIASFQRVTAVDPGFTAEKLLTGRVSLPDARYSEEEQRRTFVRETLRGIRTLPGVTAASIDTNLPLVSDHNNSVIFVKEYQMSPGETPPVPYWSFIGDDYFRAMEIPLVAGRVFSTGDGPDAPPVAIVDEQLAEKYWPGRSAVGGEVLFDALKPDDPEANSVRVVGVVGTVKTGRLSNDDRSGRIYFPYSQQAPGSFQYVIKTTLDENALAGPLRAEIVKIDGAQPVYDLKTMEEWVDDTLVSRRAILGLSVAFGILALLLSAVGIYGVLAYAVTQRTQEFGIRSALGAQRTNILRMVSGYGLRLGAMGLVIGGAGAYFVTRTMTDLLYHVEPTDPLVYGAVALLLGGIAVMASLAPAMRAVRIQPAVALRNE